MSTFCLPHWVFGGFNELLLEHYLAHSKYHSYQFVQAPFIHILRVDPFHADSGLNHVTYFGQWNYPGRDTSRKLKCTYVSSFAFSCCSWTLLSYEAAHVCLLERKDTLLLLPWPAARHMNEAILYQLATNHPSSWSQTPVQAQHQSAIHASPDLNNLIVNAQNHEISCRLKSLSFGVVC